MAALPITISIAILRYRLWDIDVIIRRTLIYGGLTCHSGAGLFWQRDPAAKPGDGGAAGSRQRLSRSSPPCSSPPCSPPCASASRSDIDRRFFRKKYDAENVVATFGSSLREEVDLVDLQSQIVAVVEETLQPELVSLWLRPGTDKKGEVSL